MARFVSPTVVFLEDLDLFAEDRESSRGGGLGELMNQLDGAIDNEDIVTIATTNTGANIGWTTNKLSSSKIQYGFTSLYTASTTESDISTLVASHAQSLSNLLACTARSSHF